MSGWMVALIVSGAVFWVTVAGFVLWALAELFWHSAKTSVFVWRIHQAGRIKSLPGWFRIWASMWLRAPASLTFQTGGTVYWPGHKKPEDRDVLAG